MKIGMDLVEVWLPVNHLELSKEPDEYREVPDALAQKWMRKAREFLSISQLVLDTCKKTKK
jgi:hypothetical protein